MTAIIGWKFAKFGEEVTIFHIRSHLFTTLTYLDFQLIHTAFQTTLNSSQSSKVLNTCQQHSLYIHTCTQYFSGIVCLVLLWSTAFHQYKKNYEERLILHTVEKLCLGLERIRKLFDPVWNNFSERQNGKQESQLPLKVPQCPGFAL